MVAEPHPRQAQPEVRVVVVGAAVGEVGEEAGGLAIAPGVERGAGQCLEHAGRLGLASACMGQQRRGRVGVAALQQLDGAGVPVVHLARRLAVTRALL